MKRILGNDERRAELRSLLREKKCLRVLEAHSPISALLAESVSVSDTGRDGAIGYDALWSSSLTDATARGRPDIEMLDIQSRLGNIQDIFEVSALPLIMDGDTGGKVEHFALNVRSLERAGVSAVIIEDKCGLKRNSLFGTDVFQQQESIEDFCEKIRCGKAAQFSNDFMIIARVESLILEAGMDDALERAFAYVAAGADGIMIHSRKKQPAEVIEFAGRFKAKYPDTPLVCVPTSYSATYFSELEAAGFNVVIYANHMLRSAYVAMRNVAAEILKNGRSHESEQHCLSVNEIISLIPGA